jgi:hypothetical protein
MHYCPTHLSRYLRLHLHPLSASSLASIDQGSFFAWCYRVTRWVCEKIAQTVAQHIFCRIEYVTFFRKSSSKRWFIIEFTIKIDHCKLPPKRLIYFDTYVIFSAIFWANFWQLPLVTLNGSFIFPENGRSKFCFSLRSSAGLPDGQTKNPNLGKFWMVLQLKMLEHFMAIWPILWYSVFGHSVYFSVLVFCNKKHLATLLFCL